MSSAAGFEGRNDPQSGGEPRSGVDRSRGFGRRHQGNLRRADAGAGSRAAAEVRDRLCGFGHWRDALDVVDRCLGVLGAPSSVIRLLSRLCSHVPSEAWDRDASLVVWPSNHLLAVELAMDVRSVQRLIALAESHGLVTRRLGRGHRRTNHRLADGTLVGDGGIDLAPMLATARKLERTLDTPRRAALLRARDAIADVQELAGSVVEAAEALDQALVDGVAAPGDVPLSIDAAIEHAGVCRSMVAGVGRRLGGLCLADLVATSEEFERMRQDLRDRRAILEDALRRVFAETFIAAEVPLDGDESSEGDSGVVQNYENPNSSRLDSAADRPVPARAPLRAPQIPGLADTPRAARDRWRRDVAGLSPSYAAHFRVGHLLEACPLLAEAAELWGVGPDAWETLGDEPMTLEVLCRHAASVAGFNGDRWGAEARRWGLARATLATAAALGKPKHLLRQNAAALLSWYFTDGLARPGVDLLATLNANRRYWKQALDGDGDARGAA